MKNVAEPAGRAGHGTRGGADARWRRAVLLLVLAIALVALGWFGRDWSRGWGSERRRVVQTSLSDVSGIAFDGSHLWITVEGAEKIYRVVPETGVTERSIKAPVMETGGSAWLEGSLYQLAYLESSIYRLDPSSGDVIEVFDSPGEGMCSGMTSDGEFLWLANWEDEKIYQIDPRHEGRVVEVLEGNFETTGLAWDGQHLWNGLLVGTTLDHDEETPATGFVQQRDVAREATLRVLPLPGVFAGTTDWMPGKRRARLMWWYDGHNDQLVEIVLPPDDRAHSGLLAAVLSFVVVGLGLLLGRHFGKAGREETPAW